MIYSELIEEYKTLRGKLSQLNGAEHETAMVRLKEIDKALKDYERSLPRFTGGSTNYKSALGNNMPDLLQLVKRQKNELVAMFFIGCLVGVASVCLFLASIGAL